MSDMIIPQSFIDAAMRTNSNVTGTFDLKPDTVHALMGVTSEVFEFICAPDVTNAFEEYADLFWFAALFTNSTGIKIDVTLQATDGEIDLVHEATEVLDILKAMYAYGSKKGRDISTLLYQVAENISRILRSAAYMLSDHFPDRTYPKLVESAQEIVINKLKARYPDKFTTEHATNRDLGYEREVLEQSVKA